MNRRIRLALIHLTLIAVILLLVSCGNDGPVQPEAPAVKDYPVVFTDMGTHYGGIAMDSWVGVVDVTVYGKHHIMVYTSGGGVTEIEQ